MIPAAEILLNRFSAAGDNNMFPVYKYSKEGVWENRK